MSAQAPVLTLMWPHADRERHPGRWLVPGDWSRGRAQAYCARQEQAPFVACRMRRTYLRWAPLQYLPAEWPLEDGSLVACERDHRDAEAYWEVTVAALAPTHLVSCQQPMEDNEHGT